MKFSASMSLPEQSFKQFQQERKLFSWFKKYKFIESSCFDKVHVISKKMLDKVHVSKIQNTSNVGGFNYLVVNMVLSEKQSISPSH